MNKMAAWRMSGRYAGRKGLAYKKRVLDARDRHVKRRHAHRKAVERQHRTGKAVR